MRFDRSNTLQAGAQAKTNEKVEELEQTVKEQQQRIEELQRGMDEWHDKYMIETHVLEEERDEVIDAAYDALASKVEDQSVEGKVKQIDRLLAEIKAQILAKSMKEKG